MDDFSSDYTYLGGQDTGTLQNCYRNASASDIVSGSGVLAGVSSWSGALIYCARGIADTTGLQVDLSAIFTGSGTMAFQGLVIPKTVIASGGIRIYYDVGFPGFFVKRPDAIPHAFVSHALTLGDKVGLRVTDQGGGSGIFDIDLLVNDSSIHTESDRDFGTSFFTSNFYFGVQVVSGVAVKTFDDLTFEATA
jgi:hypothetical protein